MTVIGRRALLAAAGAGIVMSGCPAPAAAASSPLIVTTYGGSWEAFWRDVLMPRFIARSQAQVTLDVGFGRTFSASLRAAGPGRSDYAVLMMNEVFIEPLRPGGYLERIDLSLLPNAKNLYPSAFSENGWALTGMVSPIGIGYRTDLVKTPPKRWRDLWTNTEFSGRIGLYNVQNSAGKEMVMLAGRLFGHGPSDMDAAFAALQRLGPVLQTDFNMSTMMGTGEIVVAPYDFGEIARLKRQGLPVECVIPEEGMLMWDQSFCICAGTAQRQLAYRYLDFILDPEIQLLLAKRFFVSPVSRAVTIPPDLADAVPITGERMDRILPSDWGWANRNAVELDRRWSQVFG